MACKIIICRLTFITRYFSLNTPRLYLLVLYVQFEGATPLITKGKHDIVIHVLNGHTDWHKHTAAALTEVHK
jgi:hypothetical protein